MTHIVYPSAMPLKIFYGDDQVYSGDLQAYADQFKVELPTVLSPEVIMSMVEPLGHEAIVHLVPCPSCREGDVPMGITVNREPETGTITVLFALMSTVFMDRHTTH